MTYCLIPNRNKVFENEKLFLEEKYRQGFKLEKRGFLFYKFTPITPQEVTYEIDLLPRRMTKDELEVMDWEIITTKRIFYKKLMKVYYFTESPEKRFLIDENLRLKYYEREVTLWGMLGFLLFFGSFLGEFFLPFLLALIPYLPLILIPLSILFIKKAAAYESGGNQLKTKLGKETDLHSLYVILFDNLTPDQREGLEEKLAMVGFVQKAHGDCYRLHSILSRPNLRQEIMSITTIEEENIRIAHPADLSIFHVAD